MLAVDRCHRVHGKAQGSQLVREVPSTQAPIDEELRQTRFVHARVYPTRRNWPLGRRFGGNTDHVLELFLRYAEVLSDFGEGVSRNEAID